MTHRIRPEAKHYAIRCRQLINPAAEAVLDQALIEVNNGRILKVTPGGQNVPEGAELLDFSDKTILPGLIETHGHFFGGGLGTDHRSDELLAPLYLAAGVTSARIPGSKEADTDLALRDRIDAGRYPGPRLFLSGEYLEMDGSPVKWFDPLHSAEEARLKIDHWIGKGATSVKIYAAMHGDILRAAVEHGHAHGVKVIAHVGAVTFREAIESGIDELFHGLICCPDAWPPDLKRVDYQKIFEWVQQLDLQSSVLPEMLALAAETRVVITPTAVVIQPFDPQGRTYLDQAKFFTPAAREALQKHEHHNWLETANNLFKKQLEFIRMAYQAGCILTTGTDITTYLKLPGFSLWDEMEIFVQAGVPAMATLKAATCNAAYALGRSDLLGSIEPGKLADLVVLDGSPLEDISHVRDMHRVMKAGVLYDPQEISAPLLGKIH